MENETKCNHDPFHLEPEIILDPDHFLIPILEWGPNNQLRGFMESIYIAIQLNRTLIVPPFFKHHSDSTLLSHETQDALHPNKRIDPFLVSKYISLGLEKSRNFTKTPFLGLSGPSYHFKAQESKKFRAFAFFNY